MGLLNKLRGKGQEHPEEKTMIAENDSALPKDASDIEKAISERAAHLNDLPKIPLGEITALGGAFAQLSPALRTVTQTVTVDGLGYIPEGLPKGATLKQYSSKNPNSYISAYIDSSGKSKMVKLKKASPQTVTTTSQMPIDPMMIAMAAMMVQINQKLDAIQKTQQSILSFLQEDKQAKLQGDLKMLDDILDKYKFNWENEQYRSNYHMKVLDIKQSAEQNIIFYQKQIADKVKGLPAVFLDQALRDTMGKIADDFHDYSMALYLFSYSSYLEIMLLGNFNSEYLNAVAQRIQDYQAYYQDQFSKCRDHIVRISGDSVHMKVQDALGQTGKFLGNLIASSPLLSKGQVDEWLKDSGEQLLKNKDEKMARIAASFEQKQDTGSELFVDSIRYVKTVCNETRAVAFDQDNLYLVR